MITVIKVIKVITVINVVNVVKVVKEKILHHIIKYFGTNIMFFCLKYELGSEQILILYHYHHNKLGKVITSPHVVTNMSHIITAMNQGIDVANYDLRPNSTMAEANYTPMDLLSNGFKLRSTNASINGSGTFIYMAFAEEPLVANSGTDGVPATAR